MGPAFFFHPLWREIRMFPIMLFYKYSWDKQPRAEAFSQLPNYTLRGKKKSLELELLNRAFALSLRLLILLAKKLSGKPSHFASPSNLRKHPFSTPSLTPGFIKYFNLQCARFQESTSHSCFVLTPAWLVRSPGTGAKWPDRASLPRHTTRSISPQPFSFKAENEKPLRCQLEVGELGARRDQGCSRTPPSHP